MARAVGGNGNNDNTILYELNLETDAADAAAFDTWLSDHVADVLQLDGFESAEILADPSPGEGLARRIVQYRVRDRAALDAYLASGISALAPARGRATSRALAHREDFQHGAITGNCLNCGEVLRSQHCGYCGQRARIRVLSLMGLLRDVLGDALNWDSRLWRTLRPLAFRPGLLTRDYLLGRRTHYTPPFRMYVILSVVFFVLASGEDSMRLELGKDGTHLTLDPAPVQQETATPPPEGPITTDEQRQQLVDSLIDRLPESERAEARLEAKDEIAQLEPKDVEALAKFAADPCSAESIRLDIGGFQDQVPRLQEACRKIVADSQGFGRAMYENVPRTMFVFLPLIALLMTVLYIGSGRFYVEHLLFFVHYHAFFFLGGIVMVLLDRLAAALASPALESASVAFNIGFLLYIPVYLYVAMRRVYADGRFVTLVKFLLLGTGYFTGLVLTLIGLVLVTALSL